MKKTNKFYRKLAVMAVLAFVAAGITACGNKKEETAAETIPAEAVNQEAAAAAAESEANAAETAAQVMVPADVETEAEGNQTANVVDADETQEAEDAPVYASAEDAYTAVVGRYRAALADDNYDPNNYDHMAVSVLNYYHTYEDSSFYYAYYDVDGNGTKELVIGSQPVDYDAYLLLDLYTFIGGKAVRVIDNNTFGDRSTLMILSDGSVMEIASSGAEGGEEHCYRFSEDGSGLEAVEASNGREVTAFDWVKID